MPNMYCIDFYRIEVYKQKYVILEHTTPGTMGRPAPRLFCASPRTCIINYKVTVNLMVWHINMYSIYLESL